jgi:hypothetical protein
MSKYINLYKSIDIFCFAAVSKVFGPYTRNSDGRKIVVIKNDDGSTKTMSYPKYLMQEHLGRELGEDETIDHFDSDKNNNDINNLRIMPRKEHSSEDTRRVKLIKFKCSLCNKEFERSPRLVRDKSKKGKRGIFCSRQCAGKYSRKLQLKQIDKLPVQPYIESEYYKKKYLKSHYLVTLGNYFKIKYATS